MISEGSCDTEDWSNDADADEKFSFANTRINDIVKYTEKKVTLNCNNISVTFFFFFFFLIK